MDSRNINNIITDEEEMIMNFGAFEYSINQMSSILNIDFDIIENEMKNLESAFYKIYQKGKDTADYVFDLKLSPEEKRGDVNAIEKFEKRKWQRQNA